MYRPLFCLPFHRTRLCTYSRTRHGCAGLFCVAAFHRAAGSAAVGGAASKGGGSRPIVRHGPPAHRSASLRQAWTQSCRKTSASIGSNRRRFNGGRRRRIGAYCIARTTSSCGCISRSGNRTVSTSIELCNWRANQASTVSIRRSSVMTTGCT